MPLDTPQRACFSCLERKTAIQSGEDRAEHVPARRKQRQRKIISLIHSQTSFINKLIYIYVHIYIYSSSFVLYDPVRQVKLGWWEDKIR